MSEDFLEIIEIGLTLALVDMGVEQDRAERKVGEFVEQLRESYGGERYFVKRGYTAYSPKLVKKIKKEFTGRNESSLRQRYHMSRSSFYRLIRK